MARRTAGTAEERLGAIADLLPTDAAAAAAQLRQAIKSDPFDTEAYRLLSKALKGCTANAEQAGQIAARLPSDPRLRLAAAAQALDRDDLSAAELILVEVLFETPDDVQALGMMAEVARRMNLPRQSEDLLRLAVEHAPELVPAKVRLAGMILRQGRFDEGISMLDWVLEKDSSNFQAEKMKAGALSGAGRYDEAAAAYERLVENAPTDASAWTSYGRFLKTVGRNGEAADAYRRAVTIDPSSGVTWWSLSDLKNARFSNAEIAKMEEVLRREDLRYDDRFHIHFALGKAFEDIQDAAAAFQHYAQGNRQRRQLASYEPQILTDFVDLAIATFTKSFFEERTGSGAAADGPIFILGMTRAGSTLIEQILASHPLVEGTMELPEVPNMAREIRSGMQDYVRELANIGSAELRRLGEEYLRRTKVYRSSDRPFFTDKMPNNWMHVPLIHLMLPNARILDARRHPLGCCFSNFKQHYARGQMFTYDLSDLGRYYSDYVRLMAHFDEILPGRVHRVFHEQLVEEPEREIRRLLSQLALPFDEACLRFHETDRAVRTASADQVRRPIDRRGVDQWRAFERWLEPLKQALGPVLTCYPDAPEFKHLR